MSKRKSDTQALRWFTDMARELRGRRIQAHLPGVAEEMARDFIKAYNYFDNRLTEQAAQIRRLEAAKECDRKNASDAMAEQARAAADENMRLRRNIADKMDRIMQLEIQVARLKGTPHPFTEHMLHDKIRTQENVINQMVEERQKLRVEVRRWRDRSNELERERARLEAEIEHLREQGREHMRRATRLNTALNAANQKIQGYHNKELARWYSGENQRSTGRKMQWGDLYACARVIVIGNPTPLTPSYTDPKSCPVCRHDRSTHEYLGLPCSWYWNNYYNRWMKARS